MTIRLVVLTTLLTAAVSAASAGGAVTTALHGQQGKLAFSKDGDIWVANPDGSNVTQLTTDPATDRKPSWSPDGRKIAFSSNRDGDFEIFVMNANGSDQHQLTFNSPTNDRTSAWTANGSQIVYDKDFNDLYAIDADGAGGERHLRQDAAFPETAPYSEKVVFSDQLNFNLVLMRLDGSALQQITNPAVVQALDANWSRRASELVFAGAFTEGPTDNDVFFVRTDGKGLRDLTNTPASARVEFSPVWSPDGRRIAFSGCVDFFTTPRCEIYMMNRDGSGETQITSLGIGVGTGEVDWAAP